MPVLLSADHPQPLPVSLAAVRGDAELLLQLCGQQPCDWSILLVDDPLMARLNEQYRAKKGPTNVLAFSLREGEAYSDDAPLGDVVISLDTTAREAQREGISLRRRLQILLAHGLLHLLGHDHERSEAEAERMETAERQLLNRLDDKQRRTSMINLAINVDHIATLRQARGINEPDPVLAAGICELAGAAGIVVHLREDRRHIQDRDVYLLRQTVKTKLNLEMGAAPEIINIALDVKPDMVTLVPEKRQELTTEGGLNVSGQKKKLATVIDRFIGAGIPVSLFIDPDFKQVKAAKDIGATFVEIHTGRYCDAVNETERAKEFNLVAAAADEAHAMGLRVNAGHGLNYLTTAPVAALKSIEELSIGHAIMARAIFVGLDQAVREMLAQVAGRR